MTAEGIVLILGAAAGLLTAGAAAFVLIWKQVKQVHVMVNQSHDDMLKYQSDLIESLQKHGIVIPRDPSTE